MIKVFEKTPYWYSNGAFSHGSRIAQSNEKWYIDMLKEHIKNLYDWGINATTCENPNELCVPVFDSYCLFTKDDKLIVSSKEIIYDNEFDDQYYEEYNIAKPGDIEIESVGPTCMTLGEISECIEACYGVTVKKIRLVGASNVMRGTGGYVYLCTEWDGEIPNAKELEIDKLDEYKIGPCLEDIVCERGFTWANILCHILGDLPPLKD